MLGTLPADFKTYCAYNVGMSAVCNSESPGQVATLHQRETVTSAPRILLADDQNQMLEEIALILSENFGVMAAAHDGQSAMELATSLRPDVLILDISMPVVNGIEVASRLKNTGSNVRIIFLTVHSDPEFVEAGLSLGAMGYVLKTSIATDLVPAIWAAIEGRIFISPAIHVQ